jgi:vancomycin resistance protein VanJ
MQLNMQHGMAGVDKVAGLIERERPDVLFLQEAGSLHKPADQVAPSLRNALAGYEIFRIRYEAVAIRGEILETATVDTGYGLDGRRKFLTTVVAQVAGKTVSLATLHFQPTQEDKLFTAPSAAHRRLVRVGEIRRDSYQVLAGWLRDQPDGRACIVGGDFNEHPCGPNYRLLGSYAEDAWKAAGVGFGFTIPSVTPFERIDYIWARNARVRRAEVLPDVVSDHRAVLAWIEAP